MRIVNAMFGCGQGGIEQALVDYSEALIRHNHEVTAIIHPRAAIRGALESRGIAFHALPNLGAWDPIAGFRLKRLLARLKPDTCIAHGNRAVSLLSAARAPRLVAAMHNYKIKWQGVKCLFYSTQDMHRHLAAGNTGDRHLYLIPNLVRVPVAEPVRHWHNPPVIGAMGRFVAKKGFHTFIEALALLKARGIAFRALLTGDGEEMAALKTLAGTRDLNDVLIFPGWAENTQRFFDAIDIFCLPSHHEPFGIVLLEAMAQALPVVVADSEGPSEIITGGIDGLLVPKNQPQALAEALGGLLADRQRPELLARNAYDTVKNRYDLPVVAHKLDLAVRAIGKL